MKLKKRLLQIVDLPEDAFGGSHIEIVSDSLVKVNGCRRIIDYTCDKVVMSMKEYELTVVGRSLILSSYGENTAAISGQIMSVHLGGKIC
jgi:hypothetical protein